MVNAEVTLPDQSKSIKQYKSRLRKMLAAQKDFHGGFRINVDAQVAEHQLVKVLQDLISSSLKACQMSLIVTARTSKPCRNRMEREEAERVLSDRRQRVLHAIARMNGGRGIPETLAQKRLFFAGLPAMGGENRRELDLLTLNAADLLPVEMPWRGTRIHRSCFLRRPTGNWCLFRRSTRASATPTCSSWRRAAAVRPSWPNSSCS